MLYLSLVPRSMALALPFSLSERATCRAHADDAYNYPHIDWYDIGDAYKHITGTSTRCFVFDSGLNVLDSRPSKNKALINAFSVNASPPIRSAHYVLSLPNEDECKITIKFTYYIILLKKSSKSDEYFIVSRKNRYKKCRIFGR